MRTKASRLANRDQNFLRYRRADQLVKRGLQSAKRKGVRKNHGLD